MSKEKNGRSAGMHVGSASIVMIFAILCLTVFSTLSFVTANHERSLAEKSALAVQQYYDADWQCEEIYEQIYQCLQENDNIERLQTLGVEMVQQNETRYLLRCRHRRPAGIGSASGSFARRHDTHRTMESNRYNAMGIL